MTADPSTGSFGDTHGDVRFSLSIDGTKEDVVIEQVTGEEALSELFEYEIVVASSDERADRFEDDLAHDITLEVVRDDKVERIVRGIVAEVRPDGETLANERRRTTLVVQPKLSELQRVKRSRTYKRSDEASGGYTVKDIVMLLLKDWNIESDWRIDRELEKYVLRTQFEETNYDFMRRLLAFEGIHFYFKHGPETTIVLFTNNKGGFADIEDPQIPFREVGQIVTGDQVRRIRIERRIPTDGVVLDDFNYEKPLLEMAVVAPESPEGQRVVQEHPGRYLLPESVGKKLAKQRLEARATVRG
jgi:type VI secretion system secreted protein VgrG